MPGAVGSTHAAQAARCGAAGPSPPGLLFKYTAPSVSSVGHTVCVRVAFEGSDVPGSPFMVAITPPLRRLALARLESLNARAGLTLAQGATQIDVDIATGRRVMGLHIHDVRAGGAGAAAGLRAGEYLLSAEGASMESSSKFVKMVAVRTPGDPLRSIPT